MVLQTESPLMYWNPSMSICGDQQAESNPTYILRLSSSSLYFSDTLPETWMSVRTDNGQIPHMSSWVCSNVKTESTCRQISDLKEIRRGSGTQTKHTQCNEMVPHKMDFIMFGTQLWDIAKFSKEGCYKWTDPEEKMLELIIWKRKKLRRREDIFNSFHPMHFKSLYAGGHGLSTATSDSLAHEMQVWYASMQDNRRRKQMSWKENKRMKAKSHLILFIFLYFWGVGGRGRP